MASSALARRFSTNLVRKSIFNYSKCSSIKNPLKPCLDSPTNRSYFKSSSAISQSNMTRGLRDKVRYFSPEKEKLYEDEVEYKEILCQLRKILYLSPHRKFLNKLPKELDDITPEKFRKLSDEVLFKSMETVGMMYASRIPCCGIVGVVSFIHGLGLGVFLSLSSYCAILFLGRMEAQSMEHIMLLWKQQARGKMPIQTLAPRLLYEVRKSTRRTHVAVASALALVYYGIKYFSA